MRQVVLKYPFKSESGRSYFEPGNRLDFYVDVPRHAIALDVQEQGGVITLWALVDADQPEQERWHYVARMTGEYIDRSGTHVKTIQRQDTWLVYHVFKL